MGRRDFRKHEAKKPKKDIKKALSTQPVATPMVVEVVKRKRKEEEVPEE